LQPLAVIIVTISGTILLDVNGFFDTKLASLKMQEKESSDELKSLNERKSALNAEVEALGRERDDLKQKYNQSISRIEHLLGQYKSASTKALQGESYRRQAAEAQRQLQQTLAEATAARAAAEAAKWHEGDSIRILLLDATTKKPVTGYLALLPGKPWNIRGRFYKTGSKGAPTDGQITGTASKNWDIHFELLDDRFVYSLSKQDVTASSIEITFFAPGYQNALVSVPAGYKALTVYLNPDSTKSDTQTKTDSDK
jgi:FtsZ-binding cell division protein ZapB